MNREQVINQCYQVPGQTWPIELGWLYDTISQSKSHAEIGTYCGRSLLASCGGMTVDSSIIYVDDQSEWVNKDWVNSVLKATINLVPNNISVKQFTMHSVDAARECYRLGLRFDSVFIDGCHEYAECKADIEAWRLLLNPNGLMCGHDYWPNHYGVMDAVNEVFAGKHSVFSGSRIWYYRI
jgi:hypothetical protein